MSSMSALGALKQLVQVQQQKEQNIGQNVEQVQQAIQQAGQSAATSVDSAQLEKAKAEYEKEVYSATVDRIEGQLERAQKATVTASAIAIGTLAFGGLDLGFQTFNSASGKNAGDISKSVGLNGIGDSNGLRLNKQDGEEIKVDENGAKAFVNQRKGTTENTNMIFSKDASGATNVFLADQDSAGNINNIESGRITQGDIEDFFVGDDGKGTQNSIDFGFVEEDGSITEKGKDLGLSENVDVVLNKEQAAKFTNEDGKKIIDGNGRLTDFAKENGITEQKGGKFLINNDAAKSIGLLDDDNKLDTSAAETLGIGGEISLNKNINFTADSNTFEKLLDNKSASFDPEAARSLVLDNSGSIKRGAEVANFKKLLKNPNLEQNGNKLGDQIPIDRVNNYLSAVGADVNGLDRVGDTAKTLVNGLITLASDIMPFFKAAKAAKDREQNLVEELKSAQEKLAAAETKINELTLFINNLAGDGSGINNVSGGNPSTL